MLTAQQVFDISAKHLLTQKKKSAKFGDDGWQDACMYRGPDGLKCAAGPFVIDEIVNLKDRSAAINESSWCFVPDDYLIPELKDCRKKHEALIQSLQAVHDNNHPMRWFHELLKVAIDHGLSDEIVYRTLPNRDV